MKKNVLFLALVAIFICNTAFAQRFTTNPNAQNNSSNYAYNEKSGYFKLGLCADEFDTNGGLGMNNGDAKVLAVAKLNAALVAPYVGAKIAGINVGFSKPVTNVTVFVRESATGDDIATATLAAGAMGWNQAIFTQPIVLENKDYYIGYIIPLLPASTFAISYTPNPSVTADAMLLGINDAALQDYTSQFGALAVQALLEGDEALFSNKAELVGFDLAANQAINSTVDVPVKYRNKGNNAITSLEITYTLGTNAPVAQTFNVNVAAGSTAINTITLTGVNINMGGDFTVTITKVNGAEFNGTPITKKIEVYDPSAVAERKILLEQFTTEKCGYCPSGAVRIKNVIDQSEFAGKVIWVAHHAGFYTDPYTIPASEAYLRFYGSGGTFAPAMMVDRTIMSGSAPVMGVPSQTNAIADFFRTALAVPTSYSVYITQDNTIAADRKVKITAQGTNRSGVAPTEDLFVFIFLLENGITTTAQSGAPGTYTHNNLIRTVLNGVAGTKIEWDGFNYSVTAEGTLPATWKEGNMDVVAFVAKNYMNALNNVKVINAERTKLAMTTSTDINDVDGSAIRVYAQNGSIIVDGEYTSMKIFSIDGKEFNNNNLDKGVYIVTIENNGQKTVRKVFVK